MSLILAHNCRPFPVFYHIHYKTGWRGRWLLLALVCSPRIVPLFLWFYCWFFADTQNKNFTETGIYRTIFRNISGGERVLDWHSVYLALFRCHRQEVCLFLQYQHHSSHVHCNSPAKSNLWFESFKLLSGSAPAPLIDNVISNSVSSFCFAVFDKCQLFQVFYCRLRIRNSLLSLMGHWL